VAANAHIGRWLADRRQRAHRHGTTGEAPGATPVRIERAHLHAAAAGGRACASAPRRGGRIIATAPIPVESLQHPLSVYEALLPEVRVMDLVSANGSSQLCEQSEARRGERF
jgi:hypothetical protein